MSVLKGLWLNILKPLELSTKVDLQKTEEWGFLLLFPSLTGFSVRNINHFIVMLAKCVIDVVNSCKLRK